MSPSPNTGTYIHFAISQTSVEILLAAMVPVVTASVGGIGLLIKDRRANLNIDHHRRRVMEQANLEVQFLSSWIQTQQLLGHLGEEAAAREWLARCYKSAEAAASEKAVQRKVDLRRIFLFRRLRGWTAQYFRLLFWATILWINAIVFVFLVYAVNTKSVSDAAENATAVSLIVAPSIALAIFFRHLSITADENERKKPPPPPPNLNWGSDWRR